MSEYKTQWYLPKYVKYHKYFLPALFLLVLITGSAFRLIGIDPRFSLIGAGLYLLIMIKFRHLLFLQQMFGKPMINDEQPFCIHCGFCLKGHKKKVTCPECGVECNRDDSYEYAKNPEKFIRKYERSEFEKTNRLVEEHRERMQKKL